MSTPCFGPDVPIAVRTHDARFADLPGFPFLPNYIEVPNPIAADTLRMH